MKVDTMTTARDEPVILLLVTDNHHARLLYCARLRTGHVHVRELSALREEWNEELHRRQPSRAAASGHSYDNLGHTVEERAHRFAREITTWLGRELPKHTFERLFVFAAPRVLGALRREVPGSIRNNWTEHAADLARFTEGELAQHPEIAALLPAVQS